MKALLLFLFFLIPSIARAQTVPAPASPRITIPLNDHWTFHKGIDPSAPGGQAISIPHTWNNLDGQDGGNNYFKGQCLYGRTVTVTPDLKGKQLYLRFEGVNRNAVVSINGKEIGRHNGGTQAFCFDVTNALHEGDNTLAVIVSNDDKIYAPLSADFTFWGGIYRPVELIAVNSSPHFAFTEFGASGVDISTPEVSAESARVHIRTLVESTEDILAGLHIEIVDAAGRGIGGSAAAQQRASAGKLLEFDSDISIRSPHLWNGRQDPYLYRVRVGVTSNPRNIGGMMDVVTMPLGIRTFAIDPVKGFLLNGKPYDLHGVDRHQDRLDKGWAISQADELEDMAIIKEMGCTALRLAHYQQSQFFYDLCDKEGLIVWAEIPVVNRLGTRANTDFADNARQQYTELIRQNFNHPSIAFWSAGNEVDADGSNFNPAGPPVYDFFRGMRDLEHTLDPSRPSVAAWREKYFPPADVSDYFGLNEYLGWYTADAAHNTTGWEGLESYIAQHSSGANAAVKGRWAVTEYGAGASIYFHSEKPVRMDHTEEYQALLHENTWKVLKQHPEIWGKFIWNMFDFAADDRFEGDHAGRNDKGLVTYDRKTRKDAFYFYKASWAAEPTLQLAAKRFATRGVDHIDVKAYTNAAKVTLTVNGAALPEQSPENATVEWKAVALKEGSNMMVATATMADGKKLEDTATWTYKPGAPTEIYEAQDEAMKTALKAGPPRVNFPPKPRAP